MNAPDALLTVVEEQERIAERIRRIAVTFDELRAKADADCKRDCRRGDGFRIEEWVGALVENTGLTCSPLSKGRWLIVLSEEDCTREHRRPNGDAYSQEVDRLVDAPAAAEALRAALLADLEAEFYPHYPTED